MPAPVFESQRKIHFSECDPAGIVFYPQYFVLFNDLIEQWIDELLPDGYHGVLGPRRVGLPTVHLEVDFKAVSKMGDQVRLSLDVERIGQKSFTLGWRCTGVDGVIRMAAHQTIVTTSLDTHTSIPIPEDLRAGIERAANAGAAALGR
ncbi:acyl-CoA thioesterase [Burkholderia multivorans]|uniref:acyl-CoA thioesterase n=1 Tax=Burkholderia multivorans TaxID=87883 RepID=UPI000D009B37|nr:thioesterase family protein [Burkholderia multivorans]MBR7894992.1 acyl-CoA thioesterase [Burkholderia multivorans]MBR8452753.1 acyl-CoA thioesterase [Burkholderia multivorans]MBU9449445.1 acyl-CoA thioesterase [Burkholderia multivorans]MBU9661487.1 acyl-CoA thioesterase [Burkholderia multivorans]MCL4644162.1 acyl-CoA thioesterase [Burkholderia multivorans]